MKNYIIVPYVAHRDKVTKLGKTINQIRDNMVSYLWDFYEFPEDFGDMMIICYKIRDYDYSSIEELLVDCRKMADGHITTL